jgi:hypothetical protein
MYARNSFPCSLLCDPPLAVRAFRCIETPFGRRKACFANCLPHPYLVLLASGILALAGQPSPDRHAARTHNRGRLDVIAVGLDQRIGHGVALVAAEHGNGLVLGIV